MKRPRRPNPNRYWENKKIRPKNWPDPEKEVDSDIEIEKRQYGIVIEEFLRDQKIERPSKKSHITILLPPFVKWIQQNRETIRKLHCKQVLEAVQGGIVLQDRMLTRLEEYFFPDLPAGRQDK